MFGNAKKIEIGFLQHILKWYVIADGMPFAGGKFKLFADCRRQIKNPARYSTRVYFSYDFFWPSGGMCNLAGIGAKNLKFCEVFTMHHYIPPS